MNQDMTRRSLFVHIGAIAVSAFGWRRLVDAQTPPKTPMTVYKDPQCGCCGKWVEHMQANGFAATVTMTEDLPAIRTRYKVPAAISSCHTAVVGAYVIEGHVPASDVRALLTKKPAGIVGLTIPGMPPSAPGMDMKPFQPYTVLAFDGKGATTTFARHTQPG
jgi:hypothetical protein